MKKIITIAGSNSQNSINKSLLLYTSNLLNNVEIISINLNDYTLPIYGIDFENNNGIPTAVKKLDELLDKADGFIISLAEHNGSYTAIFKNALDWLSRSNTKVWRDKPTLLMATSPGARGGTTVLQAAVNYFPFLGANVVAEFSLPSFFDHFSDDGITKAELKKDLIQKVQYFKKHIHLK